MSKRIVKRIATGLLVFVGISAQLLGGISGKIAGRVVDKVNGQALYGCNIVIEGSNIGAASDENGNYAILNVAPGSYTVVFSMIGYQSVKVTGVAVSIDLTRQLDVGITMQAIYGEAITVTAVRPMIQKDLTASTAIIGVEEMKQLPISELSEAIEMQAGFVKDRLFFYLNYRKNQSDGWIFGKRRFLPNAVAYYDSNDVMVLYDSTAMLGDDQWISMNSVEQNYFQGQVVYRTSAKSSLSYSYFYDDMKQQEYESGDRMFFYNPDGRAPTRITGLTHIVTFQKQLSMNSYFVLPTPIIIAPTRDGCLPRVPIPIVAPMCIPIT